MDSDIILAPHGRLAAEISLAIGAFTIGSGEFAAMGLLPNVAKTLHVDLPHAGYLISFYALGVVIGAPVITLLCAKWPRQRLLMALMALYVLANGLTAVMPGYGAVAFMRFVSGLPHGAFFGVTALVAASMVKKTERARAVGRVMLGLTLSTIIGAPVATWFGQYLSWRFAYGLVAATGLLCFILLNITLPKIAAVEGASALTELGAFRRIQVWFALATGAIGFGGMFAIYSYLSPALSHAAGIPIAIVPLVMALVGCGMALGNTVGARFADLALRRTIACLLLWNCAAAALFVIAIGNPWTAAVDTFLVGFGVALAPALQTRLMDVAHESQALAASLNHSAFNIANALGAWLAGLALANGMGWGAPGEAGAFLAFLGLLVFGVSMWFEKRSGQSRIAGQAAS